MNSTEHKTKTSLLREIDICIYNLKAGGRQVAVVYVENEWGGMVYTFSRPEINKENARLESF